MSNATTGDVFRCTQCSVTMIEARTFVAGDGVRRHWQDNETLIPCGPVVPTCDHEFADTVHCIKCGWEPPA